MKAEEKKFSQVLQMREYAFSFPLIHCIDRRDDRRKVKASDNSIQITHHSSQSRAQVFKTAHQEFRFRRCKLVLWTGFLEISTKRDAFILRRNDSLGLIEIPGRLFFFPFLFFRVRARYAFLLRLVWKAVNLILLNIKAINYEPLVYRKFT